MAFTKTQKAALISLGKSLRDHDEDAGVDTTTDAVTRPAGINSTWPSEPKYQRCGMVSARHFKNSEAAERVYKNKIAL